MTRKIIRLLLLVAMFSSCVSTNQYQKQIPITNGLWNSTFQPEFEMDITDTNAKYDVNILVRNDNYYPISNLWLKLYILPPNASEYKIYDRVEVVLADAKGNWLGRKFGDFWESKTPIVLNDTSIFNVPGKYKIKFEQVMRTDPLIGIHNVGLNLERK